MAFDTSIIGKPFGPYPFELDWKGAALYALGCGATADELDLLLETRGPKVLPSYSVIVCARDALMTALTQLGGNLLTLVHGAQRCVLERPLVAGSKLATTAKVTGLYDKGKGALAVYETETVDEKKAVVCRTEWQIFYRGEGGFGGERGPDTPPYEPPAGKAPDVIKEMATSPTQALLYRLTGDLNPIHSDPQVAGMAGFPKPILHGLCTFGHATRAAVLGLCGGDPDRLFHVEGRFSKIVLPGDTIVTELHRVGASEAYYVSKVKERNEAAITLGGVLFRA